MMPLHVKNSNFYVVDLIHVPLNSRAPESMANMPERYSMSVLGLRRDEFNVKLALLSNQWQGVVRRAQQRRGIIDGLIRQWQRYREMQEKLRKWLVELAHPTDALNTHTPAPLQQARAMLDAVQVTHTFMLAHIHSRTHARTDTHTLMKTHTLTYAHTHTHALSHARSIIHAHTHTESKKL